MNYSKQVTSWYLDNNCHNKLILNVLNAISRIELISLHSTIVVINLKKHNRVIIICHSRYGVKSGSSMVKTKPKIRKNIVKHGSGIIMIWWLLSLRRSCSLSLFFWLKVDKRVNRSNYLMTSTYFFNIIVSPDKLIQILFHKRKTVVRVTVTTVVQKKCSHRLIDWENLQGRISKYCQVQMWSRNILSAKVRGSCCS